MHNFILNVRLVFYSTIFIFRSTSQKLGSYTRKLYVDIKNGRNLENLIYKHDPYYVQTENFFKIYSLTYFRAFKIVIFRSKPKIGLIESEIKYVGFKNDLNLENLIPRFFETPYT